MLMRLSFFIFFIFLLDFYLFSGITPVFNKSNIFNRYFNFIYWIISFSIYCIIVYVFINFERRTPSVHFNNDIIISNIELNPSGIIKVNAYCGVDGNLPPVIVYEPLLIPGDIPKIEIRLEDIEHSPYMRDPKALIEKMNSDVQIEEGTSDIIIRGSRPGDAIYYIDGVKTANMSSVPGVAIGGLEAYTGGIPAKYGDTTGGVIVLETKSYFDLYNAWKYRQ